MTQIMLSLPSSIDADEARLLLMMKLYEVGRLSLGQAATLSGFSKAAFMELLGKHNIPVFDYPAGDLEEEINL